MRRGLRALGAMILSAGALSGCATRPSRPPSTAASPTPASSETAAAPHWEGLADAEPALLSLEDAHLYDTRLLGSAAASADPALRSRAALAIGRIGDEGGAGLLRNLLTDASPEVRADAAFATALLGVDTLTQELIALLEDPDPGVPSRAAWAIGFLARPEGQEALLAALTKAVTAEARAASIRALWRFGSAAAEAAVIPYVSDADSRIRAAALYVLARKPRESARPVLTAALTDADVETASLAARALGLLGRKESIAPLAAALEGPPAPVVIHAMVALAAVLEKNRDAALPAGRVERILALAGDVNPNLAMPALVLLRFATDDREVFRKLSSLASSGEGRRRQIALQSLMAGLRERSADLAEAALASESAPLRAAAAEGLRYFPEAEAAPRRARLAADPEPLVRGAVLAGLTTADAVRANRALVDAALSDENPGVRASAIEALSLLDDPATLAMAREGVMRSYGDRDPDVPIAAIGAAEKKPESPQARAVVEAAYGHPSTLVSRLARRSLVKTLHADPAAFPWKTYDTGKTIDAYGTLLAEARRPWRAVIDTARGSFVVRLEGAAAPMTAMNFVTLARQKFFDGVGIHRVVPGFVVQDGDPTGTGNGGPGYEIRDEINPIPYVAGTVGMALAGPDTGGSQWFLAQASQPHLDGIYTVFGQVLSGMDVVRRIEQGDRILRVTVTAGPS